MHTKNPSNNNTYTIIKILPRLTTLFDQSTNNVLSTDTYKGAHRIDIRRPASWLVVG